MPPFAAVAAIERASMSATALSWPAPGLEPSRFGKLRVAWRMLSALFAGVSPAPKHGPQNAVFTMAPVAMRSEMAPFASRSINTGCEDG